MQFDARSLSVHTKATNSNSKPHKMETMNRMILMSKRFEDEDGFFCCEMEHIEEMD